MACVHTAGTFLPGCNEKGLDNVWCRKSRTRYVIHWLPAYCDVWKVAENIELYDWIKGVGVPCLPHSQVLMGAGLAGRPPCLPHSQVLMGAGLAGGPPCLPQSGPYGCWVS